MKQITFILAFVLIGATSSIAQISQGQATYKLEMSSENPEMAAALGMMQGSKLTVMFKDKATRTVMDMGPMMQMTTIAHGDKDELLMLTDGMLGKKAILTSAKEADEIKQKPEDLPITKTDEYKEILGYKCQKVIMETPDGGEMIFWCTEKIKANLSGQNYMSDKIPGFALEFEVSQGGMDMKFICESFDKKIEGNTKELFSTKIPEGYETMTLEELSKMGGM